MSAIMRRSVMRALNTAVGSAEKPKPTKSISLAASAVICGGEPWKCVISRT
jgi:hypothetical protein